MLNQNIYANLNIFPINKKAFIVVFDKNKDRATFSAQLEYSPDIKELEIQVLLHGYKILEKLPSTDLPILENCILRLNKYMLKKIS